MISSCVIDAAPWRVEVPRQSAPVSPPPMMTTFLPVARIWSSTSSPSDARLAWGRNSIAWWMPAELAAGDRQVTSDRGAHGQHHGVEPVPQVLTGQLGAPTSTPARKTVPSRRI